jgi:FlaA1/EpsC-like NDP-sugar epimerase
VLVTGGGGSIGSELCRQILQCRPAELTILGHGENSVFDIQNELLRMARRVGSGAAPPVVRAIVADIRFADRLGRVFERLRPEVVFHAAAHKHVPLMEWNPTEALANNFLGTRNVLTASHAVGVERFVMISTDKAVNPTSVMGASKRAAELLVLDAARQTGLPYVAVRFGNVLGSRGSVVPIFKRQIAEGGPVTVSHPDMKRFFMTIPEAVQLVLQAAVLGQGGEVFMLDMGEPVKIVDLARDLIELSGLELGRDIDIEFTGIRPGEKLYEELFLPDERYEPTPHEKILNVRSATQVVAEEIRALIHDAQRAVNEDDDALAIRVLCRLAPEFTPDEGRRQPSAPRTASGLARAVPQS